MSDAEVFEREVRSLAKNQTGGDGRVWVVMTALALVVSVSLAVALVLLLG